ncbi:hypothetical protein DL771_006000 [Monosporascus sp. 5C6A]|nr:hypothetical protein DL771_006000 [Monosporascus sp. 5C6A]
MNTVATTALAGGDEAAALKIAPKRRTKTGAHTVIITDPPLPSTDEANKKEVLVGNSRVAQIEAMAVKLFQGGYLDFMDFSDLNESQRRSAPPRTSLMDDLCFYWRTHGTLMVPESTSGLPDSNAGTPGSNSGKPECPALVATIFLHKIVASNYMILVGYLESCLNELEVAIQIKHIQEGKKHQTLDVSDQWSVFQSYAHRFPEYCAMVQDIVQVRKDVKLPMVNGWDGCTKDFEGIRDKLTMLRSRSEVLNESFIGLASMAGMQESLDEAKNVRILTFLAVSERERYQGFETMVETCNRKCVH